MVDVSYEDNTILFTATCREGTREDPRDVVRAARPMVLSSDEVVRLWFRLSRFPILFASPQEANFRNFSAIIRDEYSVLIEFDDIGMALISDIVPGIQATIQISFWDSRLKGREPLIRALVRWVMETLRVRRVSAPVRADARAVRAFYERCGLYFEGALKNWLRKGDQYYDLYLYGITAEESTDVLWQRGHSTAKPRVRLLKVYETS